MLAADLHPGLSGDSPTKTLAKIASKLCKRYPKLRGGCYMHRPQDIEKVLFSKEVRPKAGAVACSTYSRIAKKPGCPSRIRFCDTFCLPHHPFQEPVDATPIG